MICRDSENSDFPGMVRARSSAASSEPIGEEPAERELEATLDQGAIGGIAEQELGPDDRLYRPMLIQANSGEQRERRVPEPSAGGIRLDRQSVQASRGGLSRVDSEVRLGVAPVGPGQGAGRENFDTGQQRHDAGQSRFDER